MNTQTLADWAVAERAGLVRLRAEPETENYFDVYGLPDGYENANGEMITSEEAYEKMLRMLDLHGCWCVCAEYFDAGEWVLADSVGMCTGYENPLSPDENCYVLDLMRVALAQIGQSGEH